jgi:energy-coupling factor transport system substrate-specific component
MKHVLLGNIQFINLPAVIAILVAIFLGPLAGAMVGFLSFMVGDLFIGIPGPWSLIGGISLAAVAAFAGKIWQKRSDDLEFIELVIGIYLLVFVYDITTSILGFFLWMGFPLQEAILLGFAGLFLPVSGGFAIFVGPLTEFTTGLTTGLLYPRVKNVFKEVILK